MTRCLLDYACIKIHYKLRVIDLSRPTELHAGPEAI